MKKLIFILATLSISLNLIAQDSSRTVILYTMSPYFGPTACEKKIQEKYGFTYSGSSHLTDRQFKKRNKQGRKKLESIHGEAWFKEYKNELKVCTETVTK